MSTDGNIMKRKSSKKRIGKEKPPFEQFVDSIREALSGTGGKELTKAVKLLKAGFVERQPDHGRVEEIFNMVRTWKLVDCLSVRLSTHCRFGKINPPAKSLWWRLRTDFVREIGYPMIPAGEPSSLRTPIPEWIRVSLRSAPADPEGWMRRAFVCILGESEFENIRDYLYTLLEEYHLQIIRQGRATESAERDFLTLMSLLLGKPGSMKKAVRLYAVAARPSRNAVRDAVNIADRYRSEIAEAREELRDGGEERVRLARQLKEAIERIDELERVNRERESELRAETDRCNSIEIHWRETLRSEMARLSSRVRERLSHEANETELCLDRQTPNVAMAIDRIRRIREFLINLGGE
jgi:hypothetical protein